MHYSIVCLHSKHLVKVLTIIIINNISNYYLTFLRRITNHRNMKFNEKTNFGVVPILYDFNNLFKAVIIFNLVIKCIYMFVILFT